MDVEWDERKAASNLKKHGVSFEEATTALSDPLAVSFDDHPRHLGPKGDQARKAAI